LPSMPQQVIEEPAGEQPQAHVPASS
jgi:hypothetical protein